MKNLLLNTMLFLVSGPKPPGGLNWKVAQKALISSFLVTALWKYCGVLICTVWKICAALVLMIQHSPRSIDGSDKRNHIECFCWIRDLGTHFLSHRVWDRQGKMGENVARSVAPEECYFWCWAGADHNLREEEGGRRKFRGNGCWELLLYWSPHSFFFCTLQLKFWSENVFKDWQRRLEG